VLGIGGGYSDPAARRSGRPRAGHRVAQSITLDSHRLRDGKEHKIEVKVTKDEAARGKLHRAEGQIAGVARLGL
jgi:hypothetical protein